MDKVLILGATGNLGGLTAQALLAHQPAPRLRLVSSRAAGCSVLRERFPQCEIVEADWYDAASLSVAAAGVDRVSVQRFARQARRYLAELEQELRDGSYRPAPVRRVHIPKGQGRSRPLGIATVKDRIAQTAMRLVLEPIFEREFLPTSFGFRPERSSKDALREVDPAGPDDF